MQPVDAHLGQPQRHSPWAHLYHTVTVPRHLLAFAITALLTTGGFMLMPFSSAYIVNNLGIDMHHLPTVYLITGVCTIFAGPLIGRAADRHGKFPVFMFGTALSIVMVVVYTHLGTIPMWALVAVNALMFVGIFSRMIPYQALAASVPPATQRGAFNAISASIQQLSGGVASVVAGHIVTQAPDGKLQHFDLIGYVVVATSLVALTLVWQLQRRMLTRP
jgi:predicted MFS family arabinose efflux permease